MGTFTYSNVDHCRRAHRAWYWCHDAEFNEVAIDIPCPTPSCSDLPTWYTEMTLVLCWEEPQRVYHLHLPNLQKSLPAFLQYSMISFLYITTMVFRVLWLYSSCYNIRQLGHCLFLLHINAWAAGWRYCTELGKLFCCFVGAIALEWRKGPRSLPFV